MNLPRKTMKIFRTTVTCTNYLESESKSMYFSRKKAAFFNLSLTSKLKYIYTALIFFCISCNLLILYGFFSREEQKTIAGLTSQTIETVSRNVDHSLSTISKTSTYLLGTAEVQNYLQNTNRSAYAIVSKQLRNSLYLSLESMPLVSSIIIMDSSGTYEGAARYELPLAAMEAPESTSWYEKVVNKKGAPILEINGGGCLKFEDGCNYITLIRLINSTEDAHPLGYMFINVSVDSLLSFARDDNSEYSDFCVISETNTILPFYNDDLNHWLLDQSAYSAAENNTVQIRRDRYLLLNFQDSNFGWSYIAAINYHSFTAQYKAFIVISIVILLISSCFFMLIALSANHFITTPLCRLMNAMEKSETGNFNHANVTPYHDEIGQLQNAYNDMVDKIQNLLDAKVSEQKMLRKAELNVLQEQIKPHFLYNSLNAISYLVTSQQNDQAYDLILSLSEYYRESLSKGSNIIPLSTEINIVKNYLKLQKMRFPDAFTDEYELQENVLSYKIPRLILQPLVENSIYHGIIPACDSGIIKISAFTDTHNFIIRISDNGVGMTETVLHDIMTTKIETNPESFGLRGTIERMQIFYETQNIYTIKSSPSRGTDITFLIPINKVEKQNERTES